MLLIPFELRPGAERGPVVIVMILERDDLGRMKRAAPLDFQVRTLRGQIHTDRPMRDLDLILAYEEDAEKIMEFRARQDLAGLLNWLERGRVHQPGDCQPPVPARSKPEGSSGKN